MRSRFRRWNRTASLEIRRSVSSSPKTVADDAHFSRAADCLGQIRSFGRVLVCDLPVANNFKDRLPMCAESDSVVSLIPRPNNCATVRVRVSREHLSSFRIQRYECRNQDQDGDYPGSWRRRFTKLSCSGTPSNFASKSLNRLRLTSKRIPFLSTTSPYPPARASTSAT